ncbi:hypothetical protein [Polaribacter porphyrae]|uniref:General secretion pathway protein n=1 Tax=Polaribacter porphyrae TaxID=1137780 RepID=A0A2S7WRR7_9FLAO|nr:hypothetical protein [Polaribacter porphyrae]PQJ80293.1 hypothetical protein BTO18_14385 [Polaribacter porphyrae]
MIGQLLKYGNTYTAIEHAEHKRFILLQLQRKKKELVLLRKKSFQSQDKTIQELKGQKHVFLVVNNEQVLSKSIDFFHEDEKRVVKNAYPNINTNDFYYEVFSKSNTSFVSIARKDTIDTIISEYQKAGIYVVDFSLGNLVIQNLQNLQDYNQLSTSNAIVAYENKELVSINEKELKKNYIVNDLDVANTEVLSLAGIIAYYTQNVSSTIQNELYGKYIQKRFFDIGLRTGLGFLLVVLLINFFVFSHYRNEVGTLTGELQMSLNFKNQLNTLQKQVTQKKQLVQSMNAASNKSISKYIDELGSSLPESNLLHQLTYQPKEGIQKKDKPLLFKQNSISVKGISKNDVAFSNWISAIEKKNWVEEVSILNYGKGKKRRVSADFEFLIHTNER